MDCDPGVKVAPTAVEFYGDVGFVATFQNFVAVAAGAATGAGPMCKLCGAFIGCPSLYGLFDLLAYNKATQGLSAPSASIFGAVWVIVPLCRFLAFLRLLWAS